MVNAEELRRSIAASGEWLLVRGSGKTFPLLAREIEVLTDGDKVFLGFLDDRGLHTWRINGFEGKGGGIEADVAGAFGKKRETIRLMPRSPASEMAAAVAVARLERANEIAGIIAASQDGIRLGRVALNEDRGRFAHILFDLPDGTAMAAIADVTAAVPVESVFTAAILWCAKLGLRNKRPVNDLWIVCERARGRAAQKLHALLSPRWRAKLTVASIDRRSDPPTISLLRSVRISELWREKAPKLKLPETTAPSAAAADIAKLAPGQIDIVHSRQGETLRFLGLPFARVRATFGMERVWSGIGPGQKPIAPADRDELRAAVAELARYRNADTPNKRHILYRSAPEAWLEAILRRDIGLLDANLVLSPIYDQFRFLRDKIDLLAIRKDGRLVIIELKTKPDREAAFQAADYWRKIELQRRSGILEAADLFMGRTIADRPPVVYLAAPAWSIHRDMEFFARCLAPEIELWRFDLHEDWRGNIRVVSRIDHQDGGTNR